MFETFFEDEKGLLYFLTYVYLVKIMNMEKYILIIFFSDFSDNVINKK